MINQEDFNLIKNSFIESFIPFNFERFSFGVYYEDLFDQVVFRVHDSMGDRFYNLPWYKVGDWPYLNLTEQERQKSLIDYSRNAARSMKEWITIELMHDTNRIV